MSETVAIWLSDLLDNEIKDIEGTIENEKLWVVGSSTEEEKLMMEDNIALHKEYIEVLKQIKEEYNV